MVQVFHKNQAVEQSLLITGFHQPVESSERETNFTRGNKIKKPEKAENFENKSHLK